MAKFPLGSPIQVLSFLRPTDTILTKPVVKTKEWAMKQTNLLGVLNFYKLFLSKVLLPLNGGTGNNILYLSGVHVYFFCLRII
jgi:hypothetical protein